jgi:hypothetical protein
MDIKCLAIPSILVDLTFDDRSNKERLIGIGDLIDVKWNANGLRKHIIGKVLSISTNGSNPAGWYIIVDGSDDFEGRQVRFSPMSILDVEVLRKADQFNKIETPIGDNAVNYLRIVKGRLQYSKDGFHWKPIVIDDRDIIEDQEGTVPLPPMHGDPKDNDIDGDGIEEANW